LHFAAFTRFYFYRDDGFSELYWLSFCYSIYPPYFQIKSYPIMQ